MRRYSRLVICCAWCQPVRFLGVSGPTRPGTTGVSHAICQSCALTVTTKERP